MSLTLPHSARVLKAISADDLGTFTIDTTVGDWFRVELVEATFGDSRDADDSPRTRLPRNRLFYRTSGLSAAPDINGGDRLEIKGFRLPSQVFEVVRPPRPIRSGSAVEGTEVELVPVTKLYPASAELQGLGAGSGSGDSDALEIALYPSFGAQSDSRLGRATDFRGDCPIDLATELTSQRNRLIVVEGRVLKITSAVINYDVPHVELVLVEGRNG